MTAGGSRDGGDGDGDGEAPADIPAETLADLARLQDVLPDVSPLAQALFLLLAAGGEARLAALGKALDLPLALTLRGASELAGLADTSGAALAELLEGASPGAGRLRLTPAGTALARRLTGETDRRDR